MKPATEPPNDDLIGTTIGGYLLLREIGRGGMGVVYEAEHTRLGRRVAIKLLAASTAPQPEVFQRFCFEARAASAAHHEGVVDVFDVGEVNERPYLVMELVSGESLRARLARVGRLAMGDALRFARHLAGTLAVVHARGIVHRDLKPENVMLAIHAATEGGELPKLVDFGVAQLAGSSGPMSEGKLVVGTPGYMSPEQCTKAEIIDSSSDVYSLAVVIFEMLSGTRPFVGTDTAVMRRHVSDKADMALLPSSLHADARKAIARALDKDPLARPAASELVTALDERIAVAADAAQPTLRATPVPKHDRRTRRGLATRIVVSVALATAVLVLTQSWLALRQLGRNAIHMMKPPLVIDGLVFLQGDAFTWGRSAAEIDTECRRLGADCITKVLAAEQPPQKARISDFYIDRYEVTNAAFVTFLKSLGGSEIDVETDSDTHLPRYVRQRGTRDLLVDLYPMQSGIVHGDWFSVRDGYANKPVLQVTWDAAQMYCKSRGMRLPTEAEWEFAARGHEDRRFPWGNGEAECVEVVFGREQTRCAGLPQHAENVGIATGDVTAAGVHDLGGNVAEWVEDAWTSPIHPACGDCVDPVVAPPPGNDMRATRGSGWGGTHLVHASSRRAQKRNTVADDLGFRCAADLAK